MGWPKGARKWSPQEVLQDAKQAKELFRQRRLEEPKERYLEAFESLERANKKVVELLPGLLADPVDPHLVSSLIREEDLLTALRYLGAPPISTDDLETLLGHTLAPTLIARNSERATSLVHILRRILDPKRFPWIYENRSASTSEKKAAVLASSVAASAQRVQPSRRSDERDAVEGAVKALLLEMGLIKSLLREGAYRYCLRMRHRRASLWSGVQWENIMPILS